jgi:AbrB family looped-hinge helix DNA binding protein
MPRRRGLRCAASSPVITEVFLKYASRVRITPKGQVTIPQDIRNRFGFLLNTQVDLEVTGDSVRLRNRKSPGRARTALIGLRGSATVRMTTDQILALTRAACPCSTHRSTPTF